MEVSPSTDGKFSLERLVRFTGRTNKSREWEVDSVDSPLQKKLFLDYNIQLVPGD